MVQCKIGVRDTFSLFHLHPQKEALALICGGYAWGALAKQTQLVIFTTQWVFKLMLILIHVYFWETFYFSHNTEESDFFVFVFFFNFYSNIIENCLN